MSPDLDLLFRSHSAYTHSVGAVVLVAALAGVCAWARGKRDSVDGARTPRVGLHPALRVATLVAATYGSHLLLDWLGTDTSPPVGIMLWWPFAMGFSKGPVSFFPPVSRDVLSREFWLGNSWALAVEVVVLGPALWVATALRHRRP